MLIRDKYQTRLMTAEGQYEYAYSDSKVKEQPRLLLPLLKSIQDISVEYLSELFAETVNLAKIDYPANRLDRQVIYEVSFFASAGYALYYSTKTLQALKAGKETRPIFPRSGLRGNNNKKKAEVCIAELSKYFGRVLRYADFFASCEKQEQEAKSLYQLAQRLADIADGTFLKVAC